MMLGTQEDESADEINRTLSLIPGATSTHFTFFIFQANLLSNSSTMGSSYILNIC